MNQISPAASDELGISNDTKAVRTRVKTCIVTALAAVAVSTSLLPAAAATATGSMAVTANILDNCTLSVQPMAFGTYVGTTANNTTTTTVSANCTLGGIAALSANSGLYSGTAYQRNMQNPANAAGLVLPYNLYTTTGRTIIWGDGTNSTQTIPVVGTGSAVNYTIYGSVPTSAVVYPGNYADTVTVTLTY